MFFFLSGGHFILTCRQLYLFRLTQCFCKHYTISNTTAHVASVDLYQFYQGKGGTNTRPQYSSALFFVFLLSLRHPPISFSTFSTPPPFFRFTSSQFIDFFPSLSRSTSVPLLSRHALSPQSLQRQQAVGNSRHRFCLNEIFSGTFYTLSLCPHSLLLTLPLALVNVIAQASCLAGNQALFAQYFGDCCCTIEKKRCIMIVLLLYLLNDEAI